MRKAEAMSDFNFKVEDGQIISAQVEDLIEFIEKNSIKRVGFGQDGHSLPGTPTFVVFKMARENSVECKGVMCEALSINYNSNEVFIGDNFRYDIELAEEVDGRGKGFEF